MVRVSCFGFKCSSFTHRILWGFAFKALGFRNWGLRLGVELMTYGVVFGI